MGDIIFFLMIQGFNDDKTIEHHVKHHVFPLTMQCFCDVFEKLSTSMFCRCSSKQKHCADDASNNVNRPPPEGWPELIQCDLFSILLE